MNINDKVTGQLFVRDFGKAEDGRRMTMLIGVVAGLPDTFKGETQYTVEGMAGWMKEFAGTDRGEQLTLLNDSDIAQPKMQGHNAGQILTSPIWRV